MSDMFPFTEKSRLSVRGNRSRGKPAQNYCIFAPDRLREKVESPFLHNIIRTVPSIPPIVSRAGHAGKALNAIVSTRSTNESFAMNVASAP